MIIIRWIVKVMMLSCITCNTCCLIFSCHRSSLSVAVELVCVELCVMVAPLCNYYLTAIYIDYYQINSYYTIQPDGSCCQSTITCPP